MAFGRLSSLLVVLACLSAGAPHAAAQLRATPVASGFEQPLGFVQDPSNPTVQIVLEKTGRAIALVDGAPQPTPFLDLRGIVSTNSERGLLGLAFAPDYASSGVVFVSFTNAAGHSVIARYLRSAANPLTLDASTRFDLIWPDGQRFIEQPFANHNGGHIAFGPDGYLYVGLGDGGNAGDPGHRAQTPSTLLGKMLRLDVNVPLDDAKGYRIPAGNPFIADAALDEIWAFGLRNPWRWSFDDGPGGTGALIIADVGQAFWEEVDYEPAGAGGRNYGWRNREGTHPYDNDSPPYPVPLTDPIYQYTGSGSNSITGGFVYRGAALPASFVGRYFFADFSTNRIMSLGLAIDGAGEAAVTDVADHTAELAAITGPSSFGVDADGELYVVSLHGGAVYRIESTVPPSTPPGNDADCPSIRPGPDWTCVSGGWLPPGHPALNQSPPPQQPPPSTPPPTSDCPTIQPGPDWTCVGGGWLPPGHPGLNQPQQPPPPSEPPPSTPPPAGDCQTIQPGPDWTCVGGGWLPPGHPGLSQPQQPPPPSEPPPPAECQSIRPGPDWTCVNGGWLPPGHPGAG